MMNWKKQLRKTICTLVLAVVGLMAWADAQARDEAPLSQSHPLIEAMVRLESDEALTPEEERRLVKEVERWYPYLRRKIKETEGAKGQGKEWGQARQIYHVILRIGRLARNKDLDIETRPLVRLLEDIVSGRIDIVDYKGGMVGQAVSLQGLFKDRSDFPYFIRILKTHPNGSARLNALTTLEDLGDSSDADLVEQAVREMELIPLSKEVPPGEGVSLEEWNELQQEALEVIEEEAFLDVLPGMRRKGVPNN